MIGLYVEIMINMIKSIIHYGYSRKQIFNYLKYKLGKRKKTILSYRPLWLLIYVTDLCNLHCKMCPHHTWADNSGVEYLKTLNDDFISIETLKRAFALFPESYFVMLAGVGEPLLHPRFTEIINLCRENHKKVKIVTNGTKLDHKMREFIIESGCVCEVQISLNAPDAKTYYSICQGDEKEYYTVLDNIRGLVKTKRQKKSDITIVASAVCGEENKEKMTTFLSVADELGVDRIDIFRYIDFNIKDNDFSSIQQDKQLVDNLVGYAKKRINAKVNFPHIVTNSSFSSKCEWFWKNISIDSKGNIGSCGRVISPMESYGNIFTNDDVWNNEYMVRTREMFLSGDSLPSECCKTCVENNQYSTK